MTAPPQEADEQREADDDDAALERLVGDMLDQARAEIAAGGGAEAEDEGGDPGGLAREGEDGGAGEVHGGGQRILVGLRLLHGGTAEREEGEHQEADAAAEIAAVEGDAELAEPERRGAEVGGIDLAAEGAAGEQQGGGEHQPGEHAAE